MTRPGGGNRQKDQPERHELQRVIDCEGGGPDGMQRDVKHDYKTGEDREGEPGDTRQRAR